MNLNGKILSEYEPIVYENTDFDNEITKLENQLFYRNNSIYHKFKEYNVFNKKLIINKCYLKLYEINSMFDNYIFNGLKFDYIDFVNVGKPDAKVLDLCGGPGGFVKCIMDCCNTNEYKINVYGFSKRYKEQKDINLNYAFDGIPCFHDVTTRNNCIVEDFNQLMCSFPEKSFDLVTADGCLNGDDVKNREYQNTKIIRNETLLCERYTKIGGNCIVKMFNINTDESVQNLLVLYNCFEKLYAVKPFTSTSINDEMYMVCLNRTVNRYVTSEDTGFSQFVKNIRINKLYKKYKSLLFILENLTTRKELLQHRDRCTEFIKHNFYSSRFADVHNTR